MASRNTAWIAFGCLVAGCSSEPSTSLHEVMADAAAVEDASSIDAPAPLDMGVAVDLGVIDAPRDSGVRDAGATLDAGAMDTGPRDTGVRDTGPLDMGVRDAGTPDTGAQADVGALPGDGVALPAWDSATVAHVREVRARGVAMGNRLTVFAKIGDSITESGSFLSDVGFGWGSLGPYTALDPTIQYFRMTALPAQDGQARNSFNRASVSATAGWTTDDALAGGSSSPFRRELAAIHPAWAIVMYGTNDIDRSNVTMFRANLNTMVDIAETGGTVVALSTIPDRNDGAGPAASALRFNDTIRAVAAARHIPLLDFWAALQSLPSHGVSADHIHPSVYVTGGSTEPAYFTDAGLRFGYNVRNLTAIQMLDRLHNLP
jgi:hypothetical protein